MRTSNYSLALHVLTEALELCPSDPSILNELGAVYMNLNRWDVIKIVMVLMVTTCNIVLKSTRSPESTEESRREHPSNWWER